MIQLAEAGGHLAASGTGGRHHHQRVAGLDIIVLAQSLVADDVGHIRRIARNGIMTVAANPQSRQALQKGIRRRLAAVAGQHHAAHIQVHTTENIDQAKNVVIIGDSQISAHLILFNVRGIDGDNDLHVILQLLQHPDLAVRRKARQNAGRMEIVKQLAAEFQIQLAAELSNPLFDLFGLRGQVLLIVKAYGCHDNTSPSFAFFIKFGVSIPHFIGVGKKSLTEIVFTTRLGNRFTIRKNNFGYNKFILYL